MVLILALIFVTGCKKEQDKKEHKVQFFSVLVDLDGSTTRLGLYVKPHNSVNVKHGEKIPPNKITTDIDATTKFETTYYTDDYGFRHAIRYHYKFEGWYFDDRVVYQCNVYEKLIEEDLTLYGKYQKYLST